MKNEALVIWFFCTGQLFLKTYSTSAVQALSRIKNKSYRHEDGMSFFSKGKGKFGSQNFSEIDKKSEHVWRNDLENIPLFIFLFLGFTLIVNNKDYSIIYALNFCISRTLHTLFYYIPKQPWRNFYFVCSSNSYLLIFYLNRILTTRTVVEVVRIELFSPLQT